MEDCGGMAERLKAAVLKTAEARASVGSNPTPSARLGGDTPPTLGGDTPQRITRNRNVPLGSVPLWTPWECPRRTGEVAESAEGNRLLSGCTGKTVPRVRIPPSPPRFSTTGDSGIRTEPGADEQEEERTADGCARQAATRPGGRWRDRLSLIGRIPPSPPSSWSHSISVPARGRKGKRRKKEKGRDSAWYSSH